MQRLGWVIGFLLLVLFGSQLPWARVAIGQNDFLQLYGGASLVGTGALHDSAAMEQVHRRATGGYLPAVQYVRPDYYAVLLKPLAALPFLTAYWLFQVLNLFALAGFLWLMRAHLPLKWLALISIPLLTCFVNGQDVCLFLFLFALAISLEQKGQSFVAGACLALCTIKPHFLILVPVVLLFYRRWRTILGGLTSVAALVTLAAAFEGWEWLLRYPQVLRNPSIHPEPFQFVNLRGILSLFQLQPPGLTFAAYGLTAILLLIAIFLLSNRYPLEHTIAYALCGSILLSFHLGVHDCALFLLAFALATPASRFRHCLMVLAFPLTYWMLMLDGWPASIPAFFFLATLLWAGYESLTKQSQPSALAGPGLPSLAR